MVWRNGVYIRDATLHISHSESKDLQREREREDTSKNKTRSVVVVISIIVVKVMYFFSSRYNECRYESENAFNVLIVKK